MRNMVLRLSSAMSLIFLSLFSFSTAHASTEMLASEQNMIPSWGGIALAAIFLLAACVGLYLLSFGRVSPRKIIGEEKTSSGINPQ